MSHKLQEPRLAYPCFGIYADYDCNAPDTQTFFKVATQELAEQVLAVLNKNPRNVALAYVDGFEYCKRWRHRSEWAENPEEVFTSLEAALADVEFDEEEDEEEEDDES